MNEPRKSLKSISLPSASSPAGGSSPILEVRDLRIYRGKTTILDEVAWRVAPGEHWVILGGNGSGKTSLLSALTGYLSPSKGTITVLDQTFGRTDWRELRKSIGIVSSSVRQLMADDEPALESVISGKYAMIDYWGKVSREDRRQALEILKQIDCADLADRPWLVLSQGERQRVLIGRALMARPRILILDEPCAGLDPVAREHFLQFLERLGRQPNSPTLVLVTHHVEEIMPVFSHVLLLRAGKILGSGPRKAMLTSARLSQTFGAAARLRLKRGRCALDIAPGESGVM